LFAGTSVCETDAVLPRAKDYAKAKRAFERAIEQQPPVTLDQVVDAFLETTADVLAVASSCWHDTDPASGAPLSVAAIGDPPGSFEEGLVYEFQRRDVNTFSELRARRMPVAAISTATSERASSSARFREMIEPRGVADELRISFADAFGTWAALVLFTARTMTIDDLRFAAELTPVATAALRTVTAARRRRAPFRAMASGSCSTPRCWTASRAAASPW
jgi:hypothetical protein